MSGFFQSAQHMPCPDCGASVERSQSDSHECDPERLLDYQMFQLRDEVAEFDDELKACLESPQGRFDQYIAERERRSDEDNRQRP